MSSFLIDVFFEALVYKLKFKCILSFTGILNPMENINFIEFKKSVLFFFLEDLVSWLSEEESASVFQLGIKRVSNSKYGFSLDKISFSLKIGISFNRTVRLFCI